MYVPAEEKRPKETKKPPGDNALDALREDIARIRDEMIKKNRDDLDAMYNIDMDNMSSSMKSLFASWTDGVSSALASVETIANSQEAVVKLVAQYDESIASIEAKADENSASITSIVQWQSDVDDSIKSTAAIQQEVAENTASITQLVEVVGEDGEVIAASVKTAVVNDESFIELVADRVTISGTAEFLTAEDVGDNGTTQISGSRITMIMDGENDDEYSTLSSTARTSYLYRNYYGDEYLFAQMMLLANGDQETDNSRYSLYFTTSTIRVGRNETAYNPAIKFEPAGGFSVKCYEDGPVYLEGRDFALIDADGGVRIRAPGTYASCMMYYGSSTNDYVFATDGIYYGGTRILST